MIIGAVDGALGLSVGSHISNRTFLNYGRGKGDEWRDG
jgi:hypothetical protein